MVYNVTLHLAYLIQNVVIYLFQLKAQKIYSSNAHSLVIPISGADSELKKIKKFNRTEKQNCKKMYLIFPLGQGGKVINFTYQRGKLKLIVVFLGWWV